MPYLLGLGRIRPRVPSPIEHYNGSARARVDTAGPGNPKAPASCRAGAQSGVHRRMPTLRGKRPQPSFAVELKWDRSGQDVELEWVLPDELEKRLRYLNVRQC